MTDRKTILTIGLRGAPQSGPPEVRDVVKSPEQLRQMVMQQIQHAKNDGIDIEAKQFTETEFDATLDWLRETLQAKRWDGFVIGFGVRGTPDFTEFFEKAVNISREVAPHTKFGFNTRPDDLIDCVRRMF